MNNASKLIKSWNVDSSWTLFLDRDGVINKKLDGYVTNWDDFSFISKVPESIAKLNKIFHKTIIVTNQQGIDKALMRHEDLYNIHKNMLEVIEYYGGHIDEIYYEPSLAAFDHYRRKPNPGMLIQAKERFPSIDFKKSIIVGDAWSDIAAGNSLNMKTVWIENQEGLAKIKEKQVKVDFAIGGLHDFCGLIYEQKY